MSEALSNAREKLEALEEAAGRLMAADPRLWDTLRGVIQVIAEDDDTDFHDSAYNTMAAIGLVYMTVKLEEQHAEDSVSGYQTGTEVPGDELTEGL